MDTQQQWIELAHPGEILKEDFLDDLGISQYEFAKSIDVDRSAIKNICDGKRSISAEMALRFGLYFNMSAVFWINLQRNYDLRVAEREKLEEFKAVVKPRAIAH